MKRWISGTVVVLAFTGPVLADVSRWNVLASRDYAQCFVRASCCGGPECTDDELVFGENCSAGCGRSACSEHGSVLYAEDFARINGESMHFIFPGDFPPGSLAQIDFRLTDPDTLLLDFDFDFGPGGASPLQPPLPSLELAVFRFDGDPSVFDGLDISSLQELINSGIITNDDVLFVNFFSEPVNADVFVDVTGIPESEIVVLANGTGVLPLCAPPDTPAVGSWGVLVLLATMLTAVAVWHRRG